MVATTTKPDGNGTAVKPDENGSTTTKPDGNGTAVKPDENGSNTTKPGGNGTTVKPDKMVVAQLNRMATGLLSNPTSMKLAPRGVGQLIHQVQTKRAPTTMALQ
ncbi:cell surface protein precursor [Lactiplantibacillus plantarum]|nr:cell surface protein precursor [Lactiplantibacillus plantarum]